MTSSHGCTCWPTVTAAANSIAVGVPARVIKTIDEYAAKCSDNVDLVLHLSREERQEYLLSKYGLD